MSLSVCQVVPWGLTGEVSLSIEAGGDKIALWEAVPAPPPGKRVAPPSMTFEMPEELPKAFLLEGVKGSGGLRDVTLVARFQKAGVTLEDTVKLTVLKVDIQVDGTTEETEEDPGAFFSVNEDDDDEDGVIDVLDADGVVGPEGYDGELRTVTVARPLAKDPGTDKVTLTWTEGPIHVYLGRDKTDQIFQDGVHNVFAVSDLPKDVYVEGVSPGSHLYVRASLSTAALVVVDNANSTIIRVDLLVNDSYPETDDYVAKEKPPGQEEEIRPEPANSPAGAADNHIPLLAILAGAPETTFLLRLSHRGGGGVRITKDDGTPFPPGGEQIVGETPLSLWLYGTTPSEALNDVVIEARTDKTGDAVCGSEDVTVVWFEEEDLHFRGSDHQDEPLTPGSTALFTEFYALYWDLVGKQLYHWPGVHDFDASHWQMEIRCQPKPNVVMPGLVWDIKRRASYAVWGPGAGGLTRIVWVGGSDWGPDDSPPDNDEDLDQDPALTSLFVIDGPGAALLPLAAGYRRADKGKFQEWVEVEIGGKWYVCSPYKKWRSIAHLLFDTNLGRWIQDGTKTNEVVPGDITGFAGSWTDDYEN